MARGPSRGATQPLGGEAGGTGGGGPGGGEVARPEAVVSHEAPLARTASGGDGAAHGLRVVPVERWQLTRLYDVRFLRQRAHDDGHADGGVDVGGDEAGVGGDLAPG